MTSAHLFIASGIFHPESGGPATYLHRLAPELQTRGWEVKLVTYSDDTPTVSYPYDVTRIPRRRLPIRMVHYARAARPLLSWADVVYVHALGLPLIGSVAAPRVIKIVGDQGWERAIRKGWIAPTTDVDVYQTLTLGGAAALDRAARAREARAYDRVIVPSAYLKRMVTGWGVDADKIDVVYNALPPTPDVTIPQREARARLNMPIDAPILLSVGRLVPWKGLNHMIAALRACDHPNARLVIAGDGDEQAALQTQAADLGDRVTFLGRVGRDLMPVWMRAADYVVLYSGYEGLSHTLLESLHAGTPVIASDKGGNPEVVTHGVNGVLVPYVDVEALTAALNEALRPGTRDRLAAHAHEGMGRFQFDRMIARTDEILRSFLV